MGTLSKELKKLGYEPTEQESPFDESGTLWTNSFELVCDETALVIRKDASDRNRRDQEKNEEPVYRYRYTDTVKLPGGYVGSYDWGTDDEDRFRYDLNV